MGWAGGWVGRASALLAWLAAGPVAAEFAGEIAVEGRGFAHQGLHGRSSRGNGSLAIEPEYYRDFQGGDHRLVLTPFLRWDPGDGRRTHLDMREFYWRRSFASADLYVGSRTVFWGVTESLHLVDIINQKDLVENPDGEDKLGQPMVQVAWSRERVALEFYLLPYFRERTFPGRRGRLGLGAPIGRAVYEADAGRWHLDAALRWSRIGASFDVGVAHFYGTGRDPRLVLSSADGSDRRWVPHYDLLHQTGVDMQYVRGNGLAKLEAVFRYGVDGGSWAAVGGCEYTLVGVLQTAVDLGIIGEYQYDNRGAPFAPIGDGDIAVGGRLNFNDEQGSTLLAFVATDVQNGSAFVALEGSRRLTESGALEVELRFFANVDRTDPLYGLRCDDYAQIVYRLYF